ncbi:MAG: hypothetical protein ABL899_01670 [Nitrospira sp.]
MDDDFELKDGDLEMEEEDDDFDPESLVAGGKKGSKKIPLEEDLDALAEEEDETLPEDSYDDDKDLW